MTRTTSRRAAIAIVMIILVSDAALGMFGDAFPQDPGAADAAVDAAQTTWEGGGPLRAFLDPIDRWVSDHHASMHDPSLLLEDYYGGAVPGEDDDAQRWRHEPYRWGHHVVAVQPGTPPGSDGAWRHEEGFWRYGDGDAYRGGFLAELVSPVVDLRSVSLPGMEGAATNPQDAATAALMLRHAYDFQQSGGQLLDGGRVEVSFLDPASSQWAPWEGIEPTHRLLRIGDGTLQARATVAGRAVDVDAEADADPDGSGLRRAEASIQTSATNATTINGTSPLDSQLNQPPRVPPHMHQGNITSTGGGNSLDPRGTWQGFGGRSGDWSAGIPWVESVFDLSDHAGHLVRLRFLVSTAGAVETDDEASGRTPGRGWLLDHVEVHANGAPGIDVLGLASPGEAAIVSPHSDFVPAIALHNRGPDPVTVQVTFRVGDGHDTRSIRVGTGSLGRAFLPADASFHELLGGEAAPGVHRIHVEARLRHEDAERVGDLALQPPAAPLLRSFHVLVGHGAGVAASQLEFFRIATVGGEEVEQRRSDLHIGQQARIHTRITNLASTPADLDLTGAPHEGQPSLHPVLLDALGRTVGEAVPDGNDSVELPVSRTTSGTLGQPAPALRASWTWDGSPTAQPLRLVLRNEHGDTVLDGGVVLVDSARPPTLDLDYRNPWSWDGCQRHASLDGVRGVLRCQDGTVNASAARLLAFDVPEGGTINLTLTYRGGPLDATLHHNQTPNPGAVPDTAIAWDEQDTVELDVAPTWRKTSIQIGSLDDGWSGWIRLHVEAQQQVDLDEAVVELVTTRNGQEGRRVLSSALFDVTARAVQDVIEAAPGSLMVHLDGVDAWHGGEVEDVPVPVVPSQVASAVVPASRLVEDAILQLPRPLDLRDVGRPVLRFQHWHDLGTGVAVVEAARAPIDLRDEVEAIGEATPDVDAPDPGPPAAGHALPPSDLTWVPLATFRGASGQTGMQEARVALWDHAGEAVHLRFRYHQEADPALSAAPPGWVVAGARVEGQDSWEGPVVVYPTKGDVPVVRGGDVVAGFKLPDAQTNHWKGPDGEEPEPTISPPKNPPPFQAYPGSRFQTEAVELGGMATPVLTLVNSGAFGYSYSVTTNLVGDPPTQVSFCYLSPPSSANHYLVDLEYQVRRPDGTWPAAWTSATPYLGEPRLLDPDAEEVGRPFGGAHPVKVMGLENKVPCSTLGGFKGTFSYENATHRFDLSPLLSHGTEARFRLLSNPVPTDEWTLHALQVADADHITDAAVTGITVEGGDADRILQVRPELLSGDEHVLAGEAALVHVEVRNQGKIGLDVEVQLQAVAQDVVLERPVAVSWRMDNGDGSFTDTGGDTAVIRGLEPRGIQDTVQDLLFLVDFGSAPPGNYTLSARVTATNGVDTDPGDDLRDVPVRLLPFRDLRIDVASSGVDPFIGPLDAQRTIHTRLTNHGNVDEEEAVVSAQLVEMTSLTEFRALDVGPDLLVPKTFQLAPRGSGDAEPAWLLDASGLGDVLKPGHKYAVKITAHPGSGSVKQWWGSPQERGTPLAEVGAGGVIHNLTRMPVASCHCALVPFLVESTLVGTDLTEANSTTLLGKTFPAQDLVADWNATTLLDGEVLPPGDDGLPRWRLVEAAEAKEAFPGQATGKAWLLPAHEGREALTHVLESPPLPAHVVRPDSRAVLDVRHASGLGPDQTRVEVRTREGDTWSEWVAADHMRSRRVAVVLAPDFPLVTPSGLTSVANAYNTGIANHPMPPFYDNPGNQSYIHDDGTCGNPGGGALARCQWTPLRQDLFTWQGNEVWLRALNDTLLGLQGEFGTEGIALFTTISDDGLRFDTQQRHGGLFYDVTDGPDTRSFPVRGMDDLGLRMDTYGAILVVGDGVTLPFANESARLRAMSHGPDDPAHNDTLDDIHRRHQADLEAILRAAPQAGVRVVGALGPAAAAVARSGVADGARVAVWQSYPSMPDFDHQTVAGNHLRCTQGQAASTDQPWSGCRVTTGLSRPVDQNNPANYRYFSPYDAQSLALLDLIEAGGAQAAWMQGFDTPLAAPTGQCPNPHPLTFVSVVQVCRNHDRVVWHPAEPGRPAIITAGWPEDVEAWVDKVFEATTSGTGGLPAGDGAWGSLPPDLAYPVGGRFLRNADGSDRFEGELMQFRLVVDSDPAGGGHGALAVDGFTLMGSNRTGGVGIRLVEPRHEHAYAPGERLPLVIQASNRGTSSTGPISGELRIEQQWMGSGNECVLPLPENPIPVAVKGLDPGQIQAIHIDPEVFHGIPRAASCPIPLHEQGNRVWFNATLPQRFGDSDTGDDAHAVMAFARRVIDAAGVESVAVAPNQAVAGDPDPVVRVGLRNGNTQAQSFTVKATVEHARPLPCLLDRDRHDEVLGCGPGQAIQDETVTQALLTRTKQATLARGAGGVEEVRLPLAEAGIGPGVYQVRTTVSHFLAGTQQRAEEEHVRWLHVAPHPDPAQARHALPPDGALAADWDDLSGLASLPPTPGGQGWVPGGFSLTGPSSVPQDTDTGPRTHGGAFGPDPATTDASGGALSHGWSVVACPDCPGSTSRVLDWRRDAAPTFTGPPPQGVRTDGGPGNFEALGMGDFGPDRVMWHPHATQETKALPDPSGAQPHLSLASLEQPVLSVLTRFTASQNTALVVEMQVAQRSNCPVVGTTTQTRCDGNNMWVWDGVPWQPLALQGAGVQQSASNPPVAEENPRMCGAQGPTGGFPCMDRNAPSNPLGGRLGVWGGQSGVHDGDGGWQRLVYPLDLSPHSSVWNYCDMVAGNTFSNGGERRRDDMNPCRYANAMGGTSGQSTEVNNEENYVARPVRFRFSAASHGGDTGSSFWQVADVALTGHQVAFVGPDSIELDTREAETSLRPLLVRNTGSVDDVVELRCRLPHGSALLGAEETVVELVASASAQPAPCSFEDDAAVLAIPLAPGQSRAVWLRVTADIMDDVRPGTTHFFPFVVEARSRLAPTVEDSLYVNARLRTTAWPDIHAVELLIDGAGQDGQAPRRSVHDPVQTTLRLRNDGDRPIGGDAPVHVRLVAQRVNASTGEILSEEVAHSLFWDKPIRPAPAQDTFIPIPEWTPRTEGAYILVAEANRPRLADDGAVGLPEKTLSNNNAAHHVVVGPVSFPDLHVTDAWLVPFEGGGCGQQRAARAVAGHPYCVAAEVENRGKARALHPEVHFGIDGSPPFSIERGFPETGFPSGGSAVVLSSPWNAGLRSDGTGTWRFYVDAEMSGFSPNPANKSRTLPVHVDAYALRVEDAPEEVLVGPGREVAFLVNITNKGTAPASPLVRVLGAQESLRVHVEQAPQLLAQERGQVSVVVRGAHSLQTGAEAPSIVFTTAEDPKVQAPLPTRLAVATEPAAGAAALPLRAAPGETRLRLALDNAEGARTLVWRAEAAESPLRLEGWENTTLPYERILAEVPATVAPHTPPGAYLPNVTLVADQDSLVERVRVPVPLHVEAAPRLEADVATPTAHTIVGQAANVDLRLGNPGNVPVLVDLPSRVDAGTVRNTSVDLPLLLHPGQERVVRLHVAGEPVERLLGTTTVRWRPVDEAEWREHPDVLWQVHQQPGRLEIVETDLDDIRLRPGSVHVASVVVANTAARSAEAEVLAVVDGVVEGVASIRLDAGQERQVQVPFRAGEAGRAQQILLVVRPAGVDAGLDDPAFHAVGDVESRVATPEAGSSLSVPHAGLIPLAGMLALLARRRRGAP